MDRLTRHITAAELIAAHACEPALDAVGPDGVTLDEAGLDRLAGHPDGVAWGQWLLTESGLCPAPIRTRYAADLAPIRTRYAADLASVVTRYDADLASVARYAADLASIRTRYDADLAPIRTRYAADRAPIVRAALLAWGRA